MARNIPPQKRPEMLAVVGPTATGKTIIGVRLAKALHSEVISVDSQLVYQGLNIGVAKPTPDEMLGVPHHMIDVVPPTASFSAGDYAEIARPILEQLLSENKSPILVGGTGFYLRALLQPAHLPKVVTDPAIRAQLKNRLSVEGSEALYAELNQRDPQRAAKLHPHDSVRVIRALEMIHHTGQPIPETPTGFASPIQVIGLAYADRQKHITTIRRRLDRMMADGFLAEVEHLYNTYGLCLGMQKAHGYPELVDVITGKRSLEDAMAQIEINIRQYSRRQMTWFRKIPGIQWFYVDETDSQEIARQVLCPAAL